MTTQAQTRQYRLGDLTDNSDWRADARCIGVDPELFFPMPGANGRAAIRICAECAVREPCLDYALTVPERYGIYGGVSEKDRRALRRRMGRGA